MDEWDNFFNLPVSLCKAKLTSRHERVNFTYLY